MALNPATRLKVKADTAYVPDEQGGVYFRNNSGAFRMTGSMMDRWIEKLFPVWNGMHTMEQLTEGLPEAHRTRMYEIGETLLQNGFVRDVSEDLPHSLSEEVLRQYEAQIDFLDNLQGSGAHRFQKFRQQKVLAAGSGWFGVSLASALLETGLPRFHLLLTNPEPDQQARVAELAAHARQSDSEVLVEQLAAPDTGGIAWEQVIAPYEWIVYGSGEEGIGELRVLHAACRKAGKRLIPAVFAGQTGIAGPVVSPDSDACWESAWRRLHRAAVTRDAELHKPSSTAEAILANIVAFDLFKTAAGAAHADIEQQLYVLNLETLEGSRHPFQPHPRLMDPPRSAEYEPRNADKSADRDPGDAGSLLPWLNGLTSPFTGILHLWEEGDERQLPLSVCRAQPADPLSEGPADLLPELVCAGFTHEEARRESGLAALEAYAARCTESRDRGSIAVGETDAEALCRALRKCLLQEMERQLTVRRPVLYRIRLTELADERSQYYLTSLRTMGGEPATAAGEGVFGFPAIWVGWGGSWYGSCDLSRTAALRNALLMALMKARTSGDDAVVPALQSSSVILAAGEPYPMQIPAEAETGTVRDWERALDQLNCAGKPPVVKQWPLEPVLRERLCGAFEVSLREEDVS